MSPHSDRIRKQSSEAKTIAIIGPIWAGFFFLLHIHKTLVENKFWNLKSRKMVVLFYTSIKVKSSCSFGARDMLETNTPLGKLDVTLQTENVSFFSSNWNHIKPSIKGGCHKNIYLPVQTLRSRISSVAIWSRKNRIGCQSTGKDTRMASDSVWASWKKKYRLVAD